MTDKVKLIIVALMLGVAQELGFQLWNAVLAWL